MFQAYIFQIHEFLENVIIGNKQFSYSRKYSNYLDVYKNSPFAIKYTGKH